MNGKVNRREAIAGFGVVSLGALLAACGEDEDQPGGSTAEVKTSEGRTTGVKPRSDASLGELFGEDSACALTPQATEGPYYFDADAIRSDIREDKRGTPLRLAIRVRDADCEPLSNAVVDIWHCDAVGVYSGFESASQGGGGGGGQTDEETYLRGAQVTNSEGIVEFKTVYPGAYTGRTVHIHAKVHVDKKTMLTTQLYFDEEVTASVHKEEPYASGAGGDTSNDSDGLFEEALLLDLSRDDDGVLGVISFDLARA